MRRLQRRAPDHLRSKTAGLRASKGSLPDALTIFLAIIATCELFRLSQDVQQTSSMRPLCP
eukprot:6214189-Pleurochrysis_carterae.AAC.4